MKVAWFTPHVEDPMNVYGCILESQNPFTGEQLFLPFPLPVQKIDWYLARGIAHLLELMPDEQPVFQTSDNAEMFLYNMFILTKRGMLQPELVTFITNMLGGEWADKTEFVLMDTGPENHVN